jgi:hypothetical protein
MDHPSRYTFLQLTRTLPWRVSHGDIESPTLRTLFRIFGNPLPSFFILWGVHPIGALLFGDTFVEGIIAMADPKPKRLTYARTSQNTYSRPAPENERLLARR